MHAAPPFPYSQHGPPPSRSSRGAAWAYAVLVGALRGALAGLVYGALLGLAFLLSELLPGGSPLGESLPWLGFVVVYAGVVAALVGLAAGALLGALLPLALRLPLPFPGLCALVGGAVAVLCLSLLPLVFSAGGPLGVQELAVFGVLPTLAALPAVLWHLAALRRRFPPRR